MYSVRVEPAPEAFEEFVAELWEAGTLGIAEGDGYVDAFFEDEEAARKRVTRGLEKLRAIFAKCGVTLTLTVIAGALAANAEVAASNSW